MTSIAPLIARVRLDEGPIDGHFWPGVAAQLEHWLQQRGVAARDAVVLLPYAGLLAPARSAWARLGGWQPRIETLRTWAAALAPDDLAGPRQLSLDTVTDRASAATLLLGQVAGTQWARDDRPAFDAAVAALVDSAQSLLVAAHQREPSTRELFWQAWRDALASSGAAPGGAERWLGRIAIEWAAAADAPATDVLWAQRPGAWVTLRAGGADALADALLLAAQARGEPVLLLDADPAEHAPFDAAARLPAPTRWLGDGLEGEAQAATLAVLDAIDHSRVPVALVAQDRIVVRRIRALLERAGVPVRDETGWTLSTTRSAASVMALLRAAQPGASADELLDWLKVERADDASLWRLEAAWRRDGTIDPAGHAWCGHALARLSVLAAPGRRSLAAWLVALDSAAPAFFRTLADDAAGRAVLAALRLDGAVASPAWHAAAAATVVDLAGFTEWVDATLESASFVPPAPDDAAVVITPLSRAMLRPFGAVVMPGCDQQRLGGAARSAGLLPDASLRAFGMPGAEQARARERLAFAHILRAPHLSLLRRRSEQGEPLAASALIEHAWQARRRLGEPAPGELDAPLPRLEVSAAPQARPAPAAAGALPARLSASAVDGLRACPYRFFAQTVLGLREASELDAALEKRDYGTWLHGVLLRLHDSRPASGAADREGDGARLAAAALDEQRSLGLDAAQLLPFRAAFDLFSTHYIDWLHARDAEGWRYEAGELALRRSDAALGGVVLEGRVDRVDVHPASGMRQLIDYKTGSAQALRDKVAEPLEDTQLAFYAALLAAEPATQQQQPMRAIYLALDERKPPQPIEHPDVARSAEQLVEGLAHELARIRAGAGLPALGEGAVCDHCEARGLCRRDHWSSEAPA